MLSNEEIVKLLAETKPIYEPSSLEFKKAHDISGSLLETVSAFANTDGGTIILGIHNRKDEPLNYIGITKAQDQEDKLQNHLKNKITNLRENEYKISIENFEGYELPLIKLHIEKLEDPKRKPVYITDRGPANGTFIRIGQSDVAMPKYMFEDLMKQKMIAEGQIPIPELQPVRGTGVDDLNIELIKKYAESIHIGLNTSDLQSKELLNFFKNKNIVDQSSVTKFGLTCFGYNPQKYLHYSSAVQVSDESIMDILAGERGKNKDIFEGNIENVLDETLAWIQKNIQKNRIVDENGNTAEQPVIGLPLLREVVANALCHRDYDQNEKVFVKLFSNQITIQNPGLLNLRIYKRNHIIPGLTSHPNPNIAKYLFKGLKQAEGEGKGFTVLLVACLAGQIDIPTISLDFAGRVTIDLSDKDLENKEINLWLETKKYLIGVSLDQTDRRILAYLYKAQDLIAKGKFVINLSEECLNPKQRGAIEKLKLNGLIKEEITGSTKIFQLNEELLRNDYSRELVEVFGYDFDTLDAQHKQILSFAMQFEKINTEFSAKKLARLLYPNTPEERLSDDQARKIRKKCQDLLKKGFLKRNSTVKESSPAGSLRINFDRPKPQSLRSFTPSVVVGPSYKQDVLNI